MLKLVSFHIQAHLNAFLQIPEYFSQICLGPQARESPCILVIVKECYQLGYDIQHVLFHIMKPSQIKVSHVYKFIDGFLEHYQKPSIEFKE